MFKQALIAITPVVPTFVVLGSLLGLLASQAGINSSEILMSSLFIYSGASQFAMVEMVANQVTWLTMIVVIFAMNLRHCLMVASMAQWFNTVRPPMALLGVFFVTDESWALSIREIRQQRGNFYFFLMVALPLYLTWSSSTLLGWYMGELFPNPETIGAAFLGNAFFVAILGLFYEKRQQIIPWLVAAFSSYLIYSFISETWFIILGGIIGAVVGVLLQNPKTNPQNENNND